MKNKTLGHLFIEFISVVFAVLLALGLNSFKQNNDFKKESNFLKERIIQECLKNKLELDTVYQENLKQMLYLDSLSSLKDINSNFNISISSELLTKSAWDFTKSSRSFSYLDHDFLNDAADIYERQDYYMHISNQMFQNLGELLISSPKPEKTVNISKYYVMNLNEGAKNLKVDYIKFLKKYAN